MKPFILHDDASRSRLVAFLMALDLSKPWEVVWKRKTKRRTLNQNALYWRRIGEIVAAVQAHTGHDADEVHDFLKAKFLPPRFVEISGEARQVAATTTKLTTAEMAEYMNQIEAWAATELGLYLTNPDKLHERGA